MNDLHELCETIMREVADANDKIREAGGRLTSGDVDYIDKVTHTLKSIKSTIALMENEGGSYDSGSYNDSYDRGSYRYSRNDNGSYGRGRGRYANRDSMGRYSSHGYSRDDGMVEKLRELMQDAPNEQVRQDFQRLIQKMEQD
jgi:hypothetical protein